MACIPCMAGVAASGPLAPLAAVGATAYYLTKKKKRGNKKKKRDTKKKKRDSKKKKQDSKKKKKDSKKGGFKKKRFKKNHSKIKRKRNYSKKRKKRSNNRTKKIYKMSGGVLSVSVRRKVAELKLQKIDPINISEDIHDPCIKEILDCGDVYLKLSELDFSSIEGNVLYMYVIREGDEEGDEEIYYDGSRYNNIHVQNVWTNNTLNQNEVIMEFPQKVTHDCMGVGGLIIAAGDIYINPSQELIIVSNHSGHYRPPKESLIFTCARLREIIPNFSIYYYITPWTGDGVIPSKSDIKFTREIEESLQLCNCKQTFVQPLSLNQSEILSTERLDKEGNYIVETVYDLLEMCGLVDLEDTFEGEGYDDLSLIKYAIENGNISDKEDSDITLNKYQFSKLSRAIEGNEEKKRF
jgi:hypothetical protein